MLSINEKMKLQNRIRNEIAVCKDNIEHYNDMLPCENSEYWNAKIKVEYRIISDLNAIKL